MAETGLVLLEYKSTEDANLGIVICHWSFVIRGPAATSSLIPNDK